MYEHKKAVRPANSETPEASKTVLWGVLATFLVIVGVILVPELLVGLRHFALSAKDKLDAESSIRGSLIQLLGGFVLIVGLYFTARGFRLTREGHITDRFSKAIEQLGSDNMDVRIGGIYSLERIARDSTPDRETIINVLLTYIREHTKTGHRQPSPEKIEADVQAALSVIARRPDADKETQRLDLYHSGLNDADLSHGDFRKVMFDYGRLDGASFSGAQLDGADLSFCTARGAAFTHSTARGAHFVNATYKYGWFLNADLRDTDFYGCDLTGSDFGRRYAELGDPPLPPANVKGARFTKAKLKDTNLMGVDLSTVRGLTSEQLAEAKTDKNTIMPLRWHSSEDDE
jgi:hypothetical protein